MPNLFTLIGNAWRFYRKQPALNAVVFWFLFLPLAAINVLSRMLLPPADGVMTPGSYNGMIAPSLSALLVFLPTMLILSIFVIWGTACILLVGKRLVQSKAGRARTSFAAVRQDAITYIFPLVLTGLLRACFTFFWGLLFIVPGVIYSIRTVFYEVIVVSENKYYRGALQKSKQVVHGHSWRVFFYILGLSAVIFIPPGFVSGFFEVLILSLEPRLIAGADVASAALTSGATLLFLLANMSLYGALKKARPQHVEG